MAAGIVWIGAGGDGFRALTYTSVVGLAAAFNPAVNLRFIPSSHSSSSGEEGEASPSRSSRSSRSSVLGRVSMRGWREKSGIVRSAHFSSEPFVRRPAKRRIPVRPPPSRREPDSGRAKADRGSDRAVVQGLALRHKSGNEGGCAAVSCPTRFARSSGGGQESAAGRRDGAHRGLRDFAKNSVRPAM